MPKLLIGLVTGFALGMACTAWAASLVGSSGYLTGWDVVSGKDGDTICSEPYIWAATHEIECDVP